MSADLALVTGGSRGIGRAVAERLAAEGWRVAVVARSAESAAEAVSALGGEGHRAIGLDVADEHGWERAIAEVDERGALGGLVTAAGILGPVGTIETTSPSELRRAVEVNLVGTALALHHAVPRLAASGGRAVTLSGGGATGPLPRYDAYAASKAAVVRLTENVAATGVAVNCVAPGFIATDIHRGTLEAGPEAAGREYFERTRRELEAGGADLDAVCELVSFLLSGAAAGISGKLISAQWDPWRDEAFRTRLASEPDLATLRRIDDRGFRPA